MPGHLSKGLLAAAFMLITIVVVSRGCSRPHPSQEGAAVGSKGATEASNEVSELSPALVGKQITIRGKLSLGGKPDSYILLDNQQQVYLEPDLSSGSFTWGKPYSDMDGKLVAATGILRFYKAPPFVPTPRPVARLPDYFYFEVKTTQLRLVSVWYKPDE